MHRITKIHHKNINSIVAIVFLLLYIPLCKVLITKAHRHLLQLTVNNL